MTTNPTDKISQASWKVWYQDVFDRECPRSVEIAGQDLVKGLTELWARHLFETVQASGQKGFSRFNLWWEQRGQSIEIVGDWDGQIRLRKWIFGDKRTARKGYVYAGDEKLLNKVAEVHVKLLLAGQSSEAILTAARAAASRKDFEAWLL
jgi:hypothetical protein